MFGAERAQCGYGKKSAYNVKGSEHCYMSSYCPFRQQKQEGLVENLASESGKPMAAKHN